MKNIRNKRLLAYLLAVMGNLATNMKNISAKNGEFRANFRYCFRILGGQKVDERNNLNTLENNIKSFLSSYQLQQTQQKESKSKESKSFEKLTLDEFDKDRGKYFEIISQLINNLTEIKSHRSEINTNLGIKKLSFETLSKKELKLNSECVERVNELLANVKKFKGGRFTIWSSDTNKVLSEFYSFNLKLLELLKNKELEESAKREKEKQEENEKQRLKKIEQKLNNNFASNESEKDASRKDESEKEINELSERLINLIKFNAGGIDTSHKTFVNYFNSYIEFYNKLYDYVKNNLNLQDGSLDEKVSIGLTEEKNYNGTKYFVENKDKLLKISDWFEKVLKSDQPLRKQIISNSDLSNDDILMPERHVLENLLSSDQPKIIEYGMLKRSNNFMIRKNIEYTFRLSEYSFDRFLKTISPKFNSNAISKTIKMDCDLKRVLKGASLFYGDNNNLKTFNDYMNEVSKSEISSIRLVEDGGDRYKFIIDYQNEVEE